MIYVANNLSALLGKNATAENTSSIINIGSIAGIIGNPKAVRAVGTAVGRNPISWLIPCHRALRKSGGLGGYHWGLPVKRAMLAYEAARLDGEVA